jgi:hypothetical protein
MNLPLHDSINSAGIDEYVLSCTFLVAVSASQELNPVPIVQLYVSHYT